MMSKEYNSPDLESKTVEELTAQLLDAHSRLKALQKEREMMLANISHDLRAPLTAIRSAVDLALSEDATSAADYRKILSLIDRRTATLEDLINDMYYLFCVEDTSNNLNIIPIDACTFLEEYFYDAVIDSRYDSFDMQLDVADDLKCTIDIDPQKMARVLDNLMTNAAKYAQGFVSPSEASEAVQTRNNIPTPYIRLGARVIDSEGDTYLQISVTDNGCGISPEVLPNIFTRTYTGSIARSPGKASGSGLGLSIAKAIVERHDGSISVESEVGKGTEFRVMLPVKREQ